MARGKGKGKRDGEGVPGSLTSVVRVGRRAEHLGLVEAAAQGPHPAGAAEEGVPAGTQRAQLLHPALLGPAVLEPDLQRGGQRQDPLRTLPCTPPQILRDNPLSKINQPGVDGERGENVVTAWGGISRGWMGIKGTRWVPSFGVFPHLNQIYSWLGGGLNYCPPPAPEGLHTWGTHVPPPTPLPCAQSEDGTSAAGAPSPISPIKLVNPYISTGIFMVFFLGWGRAAGTCRAGTIGLSLPPWGQRLLPSPVANTRHRGSHRRSVPIPNCSSPRGEDITTPTLTSPSR